MRVCFWRPIVSHTPLAPPEPVHVAGIAHGIVQRYVRHKRRVRAAKIAAGWALVCTTIGGSAVAIGAQAGDWWQRLLTGIDSRAAVDATGPAAVQTVPEPNMALLFGLAACVLVILSWKGSDQ